MKKHIYSLLTVLLLITAGEVKAQEMVVPLMYRPFADANTNKSVFKTTVDTLRLPFFEDFTGSSPFPDPAKWATQDVYINNTMCVDPISRGVATFDALNKDGVPYNFKSSSALVYADTLMTQILDLSANNPGDSLYLSFFYQPQGNGFYPEAQDSLMLYFRDTSRWEKIWQVAGTSLKPFSQAMIPVAKSEYFHSGFRFMFVNKASINTNDDNWNLDYIRLAANRSKTDTAINDIAFSSPPSSYLQEYTSMPYHQFVANANNERSFQIAVNIRNNYAVSQPADVAYVAREVSTNMPLFSSGTTAANLIPQQSQQTSLPIYTTTPSFNSRYGLEFENKFFITSSAATGPAENDTIIRGQAFHNYMSYDDGSAEKSFFLKLFSTLPGKMAVKYNLNTPDTLSGLAIYFGRQVPDGRNKFFSLSVWKDIAYNGGTDQLLYQEDFKLPSYLNVNEFCYYKFSTPLPMPAGPFYVGITQPALSNSDSLYIGLDVNRTGDNHAFYNVVGSWTASGVPGALMIRPILGPIIATAISEVQKKEVEWAVTPNPASDVLTFHYGLPLQGEFSIVDMQGGTILHGTVNTDSPISISSLNPGVYFVRLNVKGVTPSVKKIIKL